MKKVRLEPVRGMRDILYPESRYLDVMFNIFKEIARSYGYEYIITPTVEYFELLAAKSGPEIARSMYVFKDKAGRTACLRPEFTASVARIYLKYLRARPKPIKVCYVGSVFRYEEPQYGRYREFFQAGVECIGDSTIYSDIEQLLIIRDYYRRLGLKNYIVRLGNVGIIRRLLTLWGIDEETQDLIIHYIDKKEWDKVFNLVRKFNNTNIDIIEGLLNYSKINNPEELISIAESIGLSKINDEVINNELIRLRDIALISKNLGINLYIDLSFARGLAYYTGFIFEVEVPDVPFSIAGGGRYDRLISIYGGPETPATGFSIGVDRSYIALTKQGIKLEDKIENRVMLIATEGINLAYIDEIASALRERGFIVNLRLVKSKKIAESIGLASRLDYGYVLIIGSREYENNKVTVKNLIKRTQVTIDKDDIKEGLPI